MLQIPTLSCQGAQPVERGPVRQRNTRYIAVIGPRLERDGPACRQHHFGRTQCTQRVKPVLAEAFERDGHCRDRAAARQVAVAEIERAAGEAGGGRDGHLEVRALGRAHTVDDARRDVDGKAGRRALDAELEVELEAGDLQHRVDDPEGAHALAGLRELGFEGIESVRLGRGYLLPPELDRATVDAARRTLLADPVVDEARVTAPGDAPEATPGARRVLVARRPGVMDPVAHTLEGALLAQGLVEDAAAATGLVGTFHAWEIDAPASIDHDALDAAVRRALANEVIEAIETDGEALPYGVPPARPRHGRVEVTLRGLDDDALLRLSAEGVLSLNLTEMRAVQAHYDAEGREPSLVELETIAQTWSEHCQHKTFRGIIEMDGEVIDNLLKSPIAKATHDLDKDW